MNVFSGFDGMSCAQIALNKLGIKPDKYYASEVDKYAIQVTQANYPNTVQMGDITKWREWDINWSSIDLIVGGSPCQGFSFAGKQLAFDDPRSALFFVWLDILNHIKSVNPNVKFMLENVKMKKEYLDVISRLLGVEPVFINSSLVSAQSRKRFYWANWELKEPEDMERMLSDVLEELPDCPIGIRVREKSKCIRVGGDRSRFGSKHEWDSPFQRINKKGEVKPNLNKSACLTGGANSGGNYSDMDILHTPTATRRYSVVECERLQTVPDNYTNHVSNTQRYKMLGNGWTVDVIAHIFKQGLL
jgi:site-specific DNA-cytosine methylase